jgi:hypothetical protein
MDEFDRHPANGIAAATIIAKANLAENFIEDCKPCECARDVANIANSDGQRNRFRHHAVTGIRWPTTFISLALPVVMAQSPTAISLMPAYRSRRHALIIVRRSLASPEPPG